MNRFLLFSCETYYPEGGWQDFDGSFDTADEALAWYQARWVEQNKPGFRFTAGETYVGGEYHIVDGQTGEIVSEGVGKVDRSG